MSRLNLTVSMSAVVLCAGLAAAGAQEAPPPPPANSIELGAQEQVKLRPEQMAEAADQSMTEIASGALQVQAMLATAKDDSDVVKVLCLDSKVGQIKTARLAAEDRRDSLTLALEKSGRGRAHHEFTMLSVLGDRVRTLVAEANECIGAETGFVGQSTIEVEVDTGLPAVNPNIVPFVPVVIAPPTTSSPVD